MEKLISYIYGDITMLKHDMGLVIRNLKSQRNVNTALLMLGAVQTWAIIALNEERKKEVESLTKEVEELKKSKGE